MKVLLINGSRREKGCTYTALNIIADELHKQGIDTELFFVGERVLNGGMEQAIREATALCEAADGFVLGSPVYYASPSGEVVAFMDRLMGTAWKAMMRKPAATIASARRAGTTATLDVLNKYFLYNQMPLVASDYWNMVHGSAPEQVMKDEEGVQIMRNIGKNMAWLLKCIEAGKQAGIESPEQEKKVWTNFIRE